MIHGYRTRMDAELRTAPVVIQTTIYTCCGLIFLDGELRTPIGGKDESVTTSFTDITCEKCREMLGREVDKRLTGLRQHGRALAP